MLRDIRATARYRVGLWVEAVMERLGLTIGIWRPLYHWAYSSEGAANCITDPELGRRVREDDMLNRYGRFFDYPHRSPRTVKLAKWVQRNLPFIERRYRIRWAQREIDRHSRPGWAVTPEQKAAQEHLVKTYRDVQESWRKR